MSSLKFVAVLLLMAVPTAAEPRSTDEPGRKLIVSQRAVVDALERTPTSAASIAAQTQGQRDSLKNGALVGAVVGALAMGTGVGLLCKALQEPTDPSCWGSVGVGALYGAGIGVAAGVGLDALFVKGQRAVQPVVIRRTSIRP
jgi:hypothetical protein